MIFGVGCGSFLSSSRFGSVGRKLGTRRRQQGSEGGSLNFQKRECSEERGIGDFWNQARTSYLLSEIASQVVAEVDS